MGPMRPAALHGRNHAPVPLHMRMSSAIKPQTLNTTRFPAFKHLLYSHFICPNQPQVHAAHRLSLLCPALGGGGSHFLLAAQLCMYFVTYSTVYL